MKRTISLILAVVMIFSIASVTAFAESTKTDALMDKVKTASEFQVKTKTGSTALGSSETTYYVKGDDAAYEYTNGFITVRVALVDGTAYAYFPAFPYLYVKLDGTGLVDVDVSKLINNAMYITDGVTEFESSGNEEIDGTTYYVETYNDRAQAKLKFCYIGDELKLLVVTNRSGTLAQSTQYTYFDGYSFSVDSSIVKAPTGINVTPLLKALFVAFLSSSAAGIIA